MPTILTVQDIAPIIEYTGVNGQTTYVYPFPILDDVDIEVVIDNVTLVLTTDFTVTGAGSDNGGTIVLVVPSVGGEDITLFRDTEIQRDTDYVENGDFLAETVNNDFDRIILMLQERAAFSLRLDGLNKMVANLDMNNFKVINVADPTGPLDAINQQTLNQFLLDEDGILLLVQRAETAADEAEASEQQVILLYNDFRDDYMGNGPNFPPIPRKEGSLFYYDGVQFTQGLYIFYSSQNEPLTGNWKLVSGPGPQGPQGAEGVQGAEGLQGVQGIQGQVGDQGVQGLQGSVGDQGPAGIQGETGSTGPQGVQGVIGVDGPDGPQGTQGVQGVQGPIGPQGIEGPVGEDGQSFKIDAFGTLAERVAFDDEVQGFTYYATDSSTIPDADPKFDRLQTDGTTTDFPISYIPDGPQSLEVKLGGVVQAPDMYTVTITTGPDLYTIAFSPAPVADLELVIRGFSVSTGFGEIFVKNSISTADWSDAIPFGKGPRGDQGPQGQTGAQGIQGDQGIIGVQGPSGPQGSVGVAGPQGATGNVGPQGQQGPTGIRGPDGIQGPQGDEGIQGNQGPQGIVGATGPQGPQGIVGDQGAKGDQGSTGPTGPTGDAGADGVDGLQGAGTLVQFGLVIPYTWSLSNAIADIQSKFGRQPVQGDSHSQVSGNGGVFGNATHSESRQYVNTFLGYNDINAWYLINKVVNKELVSFNACEITSV